MAAGDRSLSDVFQDIIRNVQEIVRSEVRLAKTEIREAAVKAKSASLFLGAGAVFAIFAILFLLLTIVYALALVMPSWGPRVLIGNSPRADVVRWAAAWTERLTKCSALRSRSTVSPGPQKLF